MDCKQGALKKAMKHVEFCIKEYGYADIADDQIHGNCWTVCSDRKREFKMFPYIKPPPIPSRDRIIEIYSPHGDGSKLAYATGEGDNKGGIYYSTFSPCSEHSERSLTYFWRDVVQK